MIHFRGIVRFLLVGGVAAGVNFLTRFAWSLLLPFSAAVAASYVTGMAVAFILFRAFVFNSSPVSLKTQVRNFIAVNAIGALVSWATAVTLADVVFPLLGFHLYALAHAISIALPAVTSWFGHRYFTFKAPATSRR